MNLYDKLTIEMLAEFHFQISENIKKGILSDLMSVELLLIERSVIEKGFDMKTLYNHRLLQT